jgi:cellulose synthase/poly-beta-1,6-N-acetylglucosamine synthase-like glycosyltransferase
MERSYYTQDKSNIEKILRERNGKAKDQILRIKIEEIEDFSYSNPNGIGVIMPSTNPDQAYKTAQHLYRRAGIECVIIIAHDTERKGFINAFNSIFQKVDFKYVVYLAQDAYPGRNWLKYAYQALDDTGKGLFAFNDGKWTGRIASFGMVRTDWIKGIYKKGGFYDGYHSHKADNELTVIARAMDMFVYDPESTLIEIDENKDLIVENEADKILFIERYKTGFDGRVDTQVLDKLAVDYKVPARLYESVLPMKLNSSTFLFNSPRHIEKPYGWLKHIPFAFYLVEILKPKRIVELSTHAGNSYFAFCQAVKELGIGSKCYAVDTWQGDEHAGFYGEDVFKRVKSINTNEYSSFSFLQQMTFDDALKYHDDKSIDLLHIDGLHTYDAVKHDFETWLPKMSDQGIILLHDTNVREKEFGVWKYFEEIKNIYPSFEFIHGNGLGVLCIGKNVDFRFLEFVRHANKEHFLKEFFASLGASLLASQQLKDIAHNFKQLNIELKNLSKESLKKDDQLINLKNAELKAKEMLSETKSQFEQLKKDFAEQKLLTKKKDIAIESHELNIEKLTISIKQFKSAVKDLEKANSEMQAEIARKSGQINELNRLIGESEVVVNQQEEQIARTVERVNEYKHQISGLNDSITRLRGINDILKNDLDKKDTLIQSLTSQIADLKESVKRYHNKILEKDKKIIKLTADLKEQKSISNNLKQEAVNSLKRVKQLEKEISREKDTKNTLERKAKKSDNELKALKSSFSWRITWPIRAIIRLVNLAFIFALWPLHIILSLITVNKSKFKRELRFFKHYLLLRKSHLFDRNWYLTKYPDVASSGLSPLVHYLRKGAEERRDPSIEFNTAAYLNHNNDVSESGMNPLVHFLLFGKKEGRYCFKVEEQQVIPAKFESHEHTDKKKFKTDEAELLTKIRSYNQQKQGRQAKVAFCTAIIGEYDNLIIPEAIENDWDYIVFTDNIIKGEHIFDVRKPDFKHNDPVRIARYIKTHPHTLLSEYDYIIWVDSNILVKGNHLKAQLELCVEKNIPLMLNPHPEHSCVYDECDKCVSLKKDDLEIMVTQINKYKAENLPLNIGHFETNIIISNIADQKVRDFYKIWWHEIVKGSRRDQLSVSYSLWKSKLKCSTFRNISNLRNEPDSNYQLFNHKGHKQNNLPYYNTPSFLTINRTTSETHADEADNKGFLAVQVQSESSEENQRKDTELKVKRIRRKLYEEGFIERAYHDLTVLSEDVKNPYLQSLAAWEVALWHAGKETTGDADKALNYITKINKSLLNKDREKKLAIIESECLIATGDLDKARNIIRNQPDCDTDIDLLLATANIEESAELRIAQLNKIYKAFSLEEIRLESNNASTAFDSLSGLVAEAIIEDGVNKVTIIISVFNAEKTLDTAIHSLLNQTYRNLEIVIVNDCSTDRSREIIQNFADNDDRIIFLENTINQGPYISRNKALEIASGDIITCMDADDWSHPEKIAYQVRHLLTNPTLIANISQWTRVRDDLRFYRRNLPGSFMLLNISSLMFWRERALSKLGYWDSVRFGADTEFYKRMLSVFGADSIEKLPPVPLSLARYNNACITADPLIGYPGYTMGVRKFYRDRYAIHHNKGKNLKYAFPMSKRPFQVPEIMTSPSGEQDRIISFDLIIATDLRLPDNNLIQVLKSAKTKKGERNTIGLVDMHIYDLQKNIPVNTEILELIDGKSVQILVYGEKTSCSELILMHHLQLSEKQEFVPEIKAEKVSVIIDGITLNKSAGHYLVSSLKKGLSLLRGWLKTDGTWYAIDSETKEWLSNNGLISENFPIHNGIWSHPLKKESWEYNNSNLLLNIPESKRNSLPIVADKSKEVVYPNNLSENEIAQLKKEYIEKGLDKVPDTFVLYRIIGNDLYPRHKKGQSRENLQFILENEPELENCEKRFVVNRIIDKDEENAITLLLKNHNMPFVHIPFVSEDYAKIDFDLNCMPEDGFLASEAFEKLGPEQKQRVIGAIYRLKNNYLMNNNGARNSALQDGLKRAKWVLPWDGNCYMTSEAWSLFVDQITSEPHYKYFVVPMTRVIDNSDLLSRYFEPDPVEEPQLAFRQDASEMFNETFCYGRRPKVEIFYRLGISGKWDRWKDDPWDQKRRGLSKESGQFGQAGWVARMYSGMKNLELDNQQSFKERGIARLDAIISTLQFADAMVSGATTNTFLSLNNENLRIEVDHYQNRTHEYVSPLVAILINEANEALRRGPYSVIDKTTLPPSNKAKDYWHPAPYWWPNPETPDGLPYIKKDGQRVPGTRLYEPESEKYDRTRLQRVFDDSLTLALAFRFTDDRKYAEHCKNILYRFFINPETAMTPHLEYAQVRMGHKNREKVSSGIIEFKDFYYYLDAVRLFENYEAIDSSMIGNYKDWLDTYLKWLLNSPQGVKERGALNNHGTCYDLQVAAIASFIDNQNVLFQTLARAKSRIAQQFMPDGTQPHEMQRTITAHYCCYNLQNWINLATLAQNYNVNLWEYRTSKGAGMIRSAEWLINHIGKPWPYKQIDEFDYDRFLPIWFASKEYIENKLLPAGIPDSKYDVKPIFFPHDGIRPFWNLGL